MGEVKKLIILVFIALFFSGCATFDIFDWSHYTDRLDYELKFLWRANYTTDKEFTRSIAYRTDYLERHDYKIMGISFHFGYTMERTLIPKFAVIFYVKAKED